MPVFQVWQEWECPEGMGGPPGAEEPMMKMLQQMYKDSVYSYLKKTGEMK
jgi:hypothetical protein